MKKLRDSIQLILVILCFVTFRRTTNIALQLSLYLILNAIIIQEFMHIYNSERDRDKNESNDIYNQNRFLRLAGIILLELIIIATVYYLSSVLVKSFQK